MQEQLAPTMPRNVARGLKRAALARYSHGRHSRAIGRLLPPTLRARLQRQRVEQLLHGRKFGEVVRNAARMTEGQS